MKSKTLTAIVLAGAMALGGAKAFAQQVITEPDPTGIVQEYYYTDGRLSGYKDLDGSVFSVGTPAPSAPGYFVEDAYQSIRQGLGAKYQGLENFKGKTMSAEEVQIEMVGIEQIVSGILALPEMQKGYVKKGAEDEKYYASRKYLMNAAEIFYSYQTFARADGKFLNPETMETILANPLFLNKDVFEHETQAVFKAYEAAALMYYKIGNRETDSIKKKEYYSEGLKHGYEDLTKRFGEDYVLGKMGGNQYDFFGYLIAMYDKVGNTEAAHKVFERFRQIAK